MVKNIYHQEFARDFSIIMEEVWFYALTGGLEKYLRFKKSENNKISPLVFYSHDGLIEVWSDSKKIKEILKKINKLAKQKPELFFNILDDYEKRLAIFNKLFKTKKLTTALELKKFAQSIFEIITQYALMYYLSAYNLGGREVIARAKKLRQTDSFYDDCDRFLRKSLLAIYPQSKNLENLIVSQEISKVPSQKILNSRHQGFIFVPGLVKEAKTLIEFQQTNKNYSFVFPKFSSDAQIIKGRVAFKGKVRGIVKIIFTKAKIKDFKRGYILVSPMTTPDYLPAMKKAAAFITDEGGITCHAAIIARELKKPCVIGTKIATKILKNGDLVEVDAEQGIVKIINFK
jgi:phosphoenolpyruvate synthase/pyruvate phosphate dikinase